MIIVRSIIIIIIRARYDTTTEHIKNHLKKSFPEDTFIVEEIVKHESNRNPNKSFKLGMNMNLFEKLLEPSLWLKNLIIQRYKFFRGSSGRREARK